MVSAKIKKNLVAVLLLILVVPFFKTNAVQGASLFFSPNKGTYPVGSKFAVSVRVASPDQAINAASGVISFDPARLHVSSISKDGSIFSLWVQEPTFSNFGGTANFEGIVLNPGFIGASGKIATINFEVISPGSVSLSFASGSVLANDGKGSNILSGMATASLILGKSSDAAKTSSKDETPATPVITSSTHPNSAKWYSSPSVILSWKVPSQTLAMGLTTDDVSDTVPTQSSATLSSRLTKKFNDGVWYAHLRFKNSNGWGKTGHFKIQIDTVPPEKSVVSFAEDKEGAKTQPRLVLDATDELSGMAYYKIKVDQGASATVNIISGEPDSYQLPVQKVGKHKVTLMAYDQAGNVKQLGGTFKINAPFPLTIIQYSTQVVQGGMISAKGITPFPENDISFWVSGNQMESKNYQVRSTTDGKFIFAADDKFPAGSYDLWAEVLDEDKTVMAATDKVPVLITTEKFFTYSWKVITLAMLLPPLLLVMLLSFPYVRSRRRFNSMKAKFKEFQDAQEFLSSSFKALRNDTNGQIKYLMEAKLRRELTEEEAEVTAHLKKAIKIYNEIYKIHLKK